MFQDFQSIDLFPLTVADIVINLAISVICGLIISVVYRLTYKGASYSVTFVHSLVLLSMITAIVLLVIGNNLARAFGLVGAMSIIRLRTAVRDTQDIVFIFFSLAVGMAAGVGYPVIAILGTILVSLVILVLTATQFANPHKRYYLLQINYISSPDSETVITNVLKQYCRKLKLVNLKTLDYNEEVEAFYHVTFKNENRSAELITAIKEIAAIKHVNLYFDEDDTPAPMR